MRKYHHLGIPTDVPREGEYYLEKFDVHVLGFEHSPSDGVTGAFIVENGAPVELLQYKKVDGR